MKRNHIIIITIVLLPALIYLIFKNKDKDKSIDIFINPKIGNFLVDVTTTGELEAKNSEKIECPIALRNLGIWEIKVNDLVPEGTVVDSGDYVATLDQTEILTHLTDIKTELERYQSQYTTAKLDTALQLKSARNEILNIEYSLEEQELVLEQSKFEPPATIRQAEIAIDKIKRSLEQSKNSYEIKYQQAVAKVKEVYSLLTQAQRKHDEMTELLNNLVIYAPKPGMVIYWKNRDGTKIKTNSKIHTWFNTVATLPDLKNMVSKTYVNEIDISKIRVGQDVILSVDAFPDKKFSGKVSTVANIGEQLPNSDAKVFEVIIEIAESDSILRPAMTSKNVIITKNYDSVLSIPLEAIHYDDTITYVFLNNNFKTIKQQVIVGESNSNEIIIKAGIEENDKLYLTIPENPDEIPLKTIPESDRKKILTADSIEIADSLKAGAIKTNGLTASVQHEPDENSDNATLHSQHTQ